MKKIFLFICATILTCATVPAQEQSVNLGYTPGSLYTMSWNTTFTLGDYNKWVGNASTAGFDIGGRWFISHNMTAGFNLSWQRVGQSFGYQTFYGDDGSAVTATNYRFTWMVPFQGAVAWHFMSDKMFSPYLGLGVGGDYMEHHLLIQDYDIYHNRWDFSLTPEVGALIRFGYFSNWGFLIAGNYKWTTNRIEFKHNWNSEHLQMINMKIGVVMFVR